MGGPVLCNAHHGQAPSLTSTCSAAHRVCTRCYPKEGGCPECRVPVPDKETGTRPKLAPLPGHRPPTGLDGDGNPLPAMDAHSDLQKRLHEDFEKRLNEERNQRLEMERRVMELLQAQAPPDTGPPLRDISPPRGPPARGSAHPSALLSPAHLSAQLSHRAAPSTAATSMSLGGRLTHAIRALEAATLALRDSGQAGAHLLNSRMSLVKSALRKMEECFDKLTQTDEEQMVELYADTVQEAAAGADTALDQAAGKLDGLDMAVQLRKENLAARPKMVLQMFEGSQVDWARFEKDADKVRALHSEDQTQGLSFLMQHCSPKVRGQIKQFSGRERAIELAIEHLRVLYGVAHLSIPALKDSIRAVKAATSMAAIPPTCSRLLVLLESLGGMMEPGDTMDPSLVHEILKRLLYSQMEMSAADTVQLLSSERVSLATITELVRQRFKTYELLRRTLLKENNVGITTGALGLESSNDQSDDKENEAENSEGKDVKTPKWKPPKRGPCSFCLHQDKDDINHWITQCPVITPSNIQEVYDSNHCIFCLQEDTEDHRKQRCRITNSKGKSLNNYCDECQAHKIFCHSPRDHRFSVVPEEYRELGHNVQFDDEEEGESEEEDE